MPHRPKRIIVGISGASGAPYATRLLQCLVERGVETHVVITPYGRRLLRDEMGIDRPDANALIGRNSDRLILHPYRDVGSPLGSGSFLTDGMIVCPCSSKSLASIACGAGSNLLDRAAAVTLKERRRLILLHREMPMSHIDLLNALRLSEAGAIICPASPGFYMLPKTVSDLVDFVVGKLMDLVGVEHDLNTRWQDQLSRQENGGEDRAT